MTVRAHVDDILVLPSADGVGDEQAVTVIEVLGEGGGPPFKVRFPSGREEVLTPPEHTTVRAEVPLDWE